MILFAWEPQSIRLSICHVAKSISAMAVEKSYKTTVTRKHSSFRVLLLTLMLPWPLTFQHQTISLVGYPKVIPYTKFEHFAIIRFRVTLRTHRQTDRTIPTHTDWLLSAWAQTVVSRKHQKVNSKQWLGGVLHFARHITDLFGDKTF